MAEVAAERMTAASGSVAPSGRYAPGRRTGSSAGAIRQIVATGGHTRVLIGDTTFDLDEQDYDGLLVGVGASLLKDTRPQELVAVIQAVAPSLPAACRPHTPTRSSPRPGTALPQWMCPPPRAAGRLDLLNGRRCRAGRPIRWVGR